MASDLVIAEGLELPELTDATRAKLAEALPPTATLVNPVDFAGGASRTSGASSASSARSSRSGEVDTVILTGYFGGYSQYSEEFEESEKTSAIGMARAAEETGVPFLAHTMYWRSGPAQALRENGVPVYREVEAAVGVASRLARRTPEALLHVPELPQPAAPLEGEQDYYASREVLAAGIPFAAARRVGAEEAVAVAAEIGYPVVLKALGELHKSDSGGVAVGLRDPRAERRAERMQAALDPPSYSVEAMAPLSTGLELIVGAKRDPRFGPILLVGAGGLYAEIVKDVAVALAPVTEDAAEALLRSLRVAPLLDGARGRPAVNVAAAAAAAAALSRFAAEHPEIAEIEINPLLAMPDGALGLDARIVLG